MMKYTLLLSLALLVYAQTPAATPESFQAGDTRTDAQGVEQVWVPAGCFQMGTSSDQAKDVRDAHPPAFIIAELPSEQPQHQVCLTEGYWIDRTEVTNADFQKFVAEGGYINQANWSKDGWTWLQTQDVSQLPVQ